MLRIVCLVLLAWLLPNEAHGRRRVVARLLPPAIEAIEPGSGPIGGGTAVTIRGSGFSRDDLSVYFDDEPAPSLMYVGVDELRAATPPHANGYVPVRVVNRGRSALAEFLYTPPALDSIAIGAITTVAGVGLYLAEGGSAIAAPFDVAGGDIAVQSDGSVLVIEGDRFVVRKIAPDGIVTRFAGRGFPLSPSEVA
ncbi:MAG TPA: IPT/TIG domain-containing protein, partial [Thermoanaerobaculia bacterium]